jgi:hypothetical protein
MEELHADKTLRHFEVQSDHGTNPKESWRLPRRKAVRLS